METQDRERSVGGAMNSNTREDLKDFIRNVIEFIRDGEFSVNNLDLIDSGNRLIEQLDKDETIP